MLTRMTRSAFESLGEEALSEACIAPIIEAYKEIGRLQGDFQSEVYGGLTEGQRGLFLFRAYYNHAIKSADDFYWWTAYFLPQDNTWSGIKRSFRFFGAAETAQLLEELESKLEAACKAKGIERLDVTSADLYVDLDLRSYFAEAYNRFAAQAPLVLQRIARYIRSRPGEFVELT